MQSGITTVFGFGNDGIGFGGSVWTIMPRGPYVVIVRTYQDFAVMFLSNVAFAVQ
jgi:hypothetical protein